MSDIHGRFLKHTYSPQGTQAELLIIEPNGDQNFFRCLCRADGTTDIAEFGGDQRLGYLMARYGSQHLVEVCRQTTLWGG